MRKILFIDIGAPYGGVESYINGLAGLLGGHAELFAICSLPKLASNLREKNVTVLRLPLFSGWLKVFRFLLALAGLFYMVARYRIDIVQVNGYLESVFLLPARMLGCTAICTRHGPFETELYRWYRNPARYFPRIACRYFIHCASQVVCVSEAVRECLRGIVAADHITVISNWVELPPFYERRPELLHSPCNLLYVGRLEKYKGLHLIFEVARSIAGVKLVVLGVGSFQDDLVKLARGLDVSFKGFCSDPTPFYRNADVFINPSYGPEGLPIVSLESMSHGLPCLFSDLAVHKEISDSGRAAMLFKIGDAEDLSRKLTVLLNDPEKRRFLSQNARALIQMKYGPNVAREKYIRVFGLTP